MDDGWLHGGWQAIGLESQYWIVVVWLGMTLRSTTHEFASGHPLRSVAIWSDSVADGDHAVRCLLYPKVVCLVLKPNTVFSPRSFPFKS